MRKELLGIALFSVVIFLLVSLLSYSPADPSIHSAAASDHVRNLFGLVGSHTAGLLVGLFGLGAFWLPMLLLLASLRILGAGWQRRALLVSVAGGLLLVVATAGLLSMQAGAGNVQTFFGKRFSSGGIIGVPLTALLARYTNRGGTAAILSLLALVGLLLATDLSLSALARRGFAVLHGAADRLATLWIKFRERRRKTRLRDQRQQSGERREKISPASRAVTRSKAAAPPPRQELFPFAREEEGFRLPPVDLLDEPERRPASTDSENLRGQSRLLEKKLEDFGVKGRVTDVLPGPVITTFEYEPAPGVKINRIVNLSDDLALALRAVSIRIVAPIPGKSVIGIEIPNADRETVRMREVVASAAFEKSKSRLTLCLGKDVVGQAVSAELDKMPHLLIAGATGAGKSVALNTMICSFLFKAAPAHVKFIMIDPKRIELSLYDGIPHLITPVVTDVKKATNALFWAVREMERRYELLSTHKTRNLAQYNQKAERGEKDEAGRPLERLPFIVIIIDELADLMMVASRDVEHALTRLAQMARAAGIHLILATQRPSVDVLTGIIKANFPTRLSFQVSSKTDSRTIIDANGAENLLGNGDMLFMPPGTGKLRRIHGAYISEAELVRITDFLKRQQKPDYDLEVIQAPEAPHEEQEAEERDARYDDAVALVARTRQASISMVQRHLRIGYNRAARIIETMEREGVVGPSDGVKPREVLVRRNEEGP